MITMIINHTGSSLSAATAFPTTAHIIPVLWKKKKEKQEKRKKITWIDMKSFVMDNAPVYKYIY